MEEKMEEEGIVTSETAKGSPVEETEETETEDAEEEEAD